MTKHLYIHIPFCNQICTFCDFKRIKTNNYEIMREFTENLIKQIKLTSFKKQYTTIYLGGGTPNHLPNDLLNNLLETLKEYLDDSSNYEFTIECNPDLITCEQAQIFINNKLNRVSIGAQSLNNKILKTLHRTHNADDVQHAIEVLKKYGIENINLDFIYDLPEETIQDLDDIFLFIKKNHLKHISFYALELKTNSILTRSGYKLDFDKEEDHMLYIQKKFNELKYIRYEVSNWCIDKKYESQHNKAYWLSDDWKALGYGASGFEHQHTYTIKNKILQPIAEVEKISDDDYYFQVLMMGLRLVDGINLNLPLFNKAYNFYKDKLENVIIDDNNYLKSKNIDLLDDTLLKIMK